MNYPYTQNYAQNQQNTLKQVMVVEPFVFEAARSLVGKYAVIETSRGSVSGMVRDAKPDHIVLQERDSTFFVRICEIVWIMPDTLN